MKKTTVKDVKQAIIKMANEKNTNALVAEAAENFIDGLVDFSDAAEMDLAEAFRVFADEIQEATRIEIEGLLLRKHK